MLCFRINMSFAFAMKTNSTESVSPGVSAKLLWAVPTIIVGLLTVLSYFTSIVLPAPFMIMLICVIVAGMYGGLLSGILAGIVASALIFHSHFSGFGPPQFTQGVVPAIFGSVLYFLVGATLGQLKDERDANFAATRKNERDLEAALRAEKNRADEQIAKVEQTAANLEMAVRIAGIGHFRWNVKTGYCEFCSEQHAAHFGITPQEFQALTTGKEPYTGYVHEEDRERFLESIERIDHGEAMFFEYRVHRPNGEIRFLRQICEPVFNDNQEPIAIVGACIDLTDLREAEARVRQSQRIEAIGTLTGGVAHDFNNLLAIILSNLELMLINEDPEDRRHLTNQAIEATQRGASLTKNLLSFSRRAHLNPTRLNLNQLVENTMKWSRRILPATISIENSTLEGLWDTDLDSTSVENAIINILLNARDAMPDGGRVTIETTNITVAKEFDDLKPGRYVMLEISDTGQGIEPDQLDRIFEPFHSNKPVGMGSGLGLSMVQGFIEQSGGAIRVSSNPGVGTTFTLFFRAAEKVALVPESDNAGEPVPVKTGAKILLVEDEEEVRWLLKRILEDAGHHITTAPNGDSALEAFNSQHDFDVLVTDVVMPGSLQGPALAKAVRAIQPDIPCIFVSGYASEAIIDSNGLEPSDVRLMKPVTRSDLLAAVSTATSSHQLVHEDVG